jgi:DNA-binding transcriptional ArsR family regulator
MARRPDAPPSGPWDAVAGLDPVLQHRSRVAAAVLLSRHGQLSFSRLKQLLDETDGNLGAQLRKLEDAGYVTARKAFVDRKPVTWYGLAAKGKRALASHLDALSRLVEAGRASG